MSNVIYSQYILSKMINELDLGAEYLTYFMMQSDGKKKKSPCVVQETLLARSLVYSPKTSFLPQLHAHTRARARARTHTHTLWPSSFPTPIPATDTLHFSLQTAPEGSEDNQGPKNGTVTGQGVGQ